MRATAQAASPRSGMIGTTREPLVGGGGGGGSCQVRPAVRCRHRVRACACTAQPARCSRISHQHQPSTSWRCLSPWVMVLLCECTAISDHARRHIVFFGQRNGGTRAGRAPLGLGSAPVPLSYSAHPPPTAWQPHIATQLVSCHCASYGARLSARASPLPSLPRARLDNRQPSHGAGGGRMCGLITRPGERVGRLAEGPKLWKVMIGVVACECVMGLCHRCYSSSRACPPAW
jgi:hypothetical protein